MSAATAIPYLAMPKASALDRLLAAAVDGFILILLNSVISGVLFSASDGQSGSWVIGVIASAACVTVCWMTMGATPGKKLFRLRVVNDSGTWPAPSEALLRYVGYWLSYFGLGLGFVWIIFDRNKQGWHDKLAGTTVVKVPAGFSDLPAAVNRTEQTSLFNRIGDFFSSLTSDVDLKDIDSWDTDDQFVSAMQLFDLQREIVESSSNDPADEASLRERWDQIHTWQHNLDQLTSGILADPPTGIPIEPPTRVNRRKRRRQMDDLITSIWRSIEREALAVAEPEISAEAIVESFPATVERSRVNVIVKDRTAYVTLPAPFDDVPRETVHTRQTKNGVTTTTKLRSEKDVNADYKWLVANRARNTIDLAFHSVPGLESVVVSQFQPTIHRTLGHHYERCILSAHVQRHSWMRIFHDNVTSEAALSNFDFRFRSDKNNELQEVSAIPVPGGESGSPERILLHEMDPIAFEELIRDLLSKMGYIARTTKVSGDGGIDVIADNPQPIVGGRVVVQCKRYRNTVGSPSVRDLYGALLDSGATKGILITTSDFSSDARSFAEGKPLELINGETLSQLLQQYGFAAAEIY